MFACVTHAFGSGVLRCWAAATKSVWLASEKKLAVLGVVRLVDHEEAKKSAEAYMSSCGSAGNGWPPNQGCSVGKMGSEQHCF